MRLIIEDDSASLSTTKVYVPMVENLAANDKMKQSKLNDTLLIKANAQSETSKYPKPQTKDMKPTYYTEDLAYGDWKSLAKSVFCNTAGDAGTKSVAVRDALIDEYNDDSFAVFVTDHGNAWAFSTSMDTINEKEFCGDWDFLVFFHYAGNPVCGCNVESSASSLQRGAMNDASYQDCGESRDLMKSRESSYGLHYSLILTFTYGAWADYLSQQCANDEMSVNGQSSLWIGDCA